MNKQINMFLISQMATLTQPITDNVHFWKAFFKEFQGSSTVISTKQQFLVKLWRENKYFFSTQRI